MAGTKCGGEEPNLVRSNGSMDKTLTDKLIPRRNIPHVYVPDVSHHPSRPIQTAAIGGPPGREAG